MIERLDESFIEFVKRNHPELFTLFLSDKTGTLPVDAVTKSGTTIIAAKYNEGVIMAGDRRASSGYIIADARAEKIHAVDRFTVIGAAGTSKICQGMARIFRAELEFYEKIRNREMSFEAKVNRLAYLTSLNLRGLRAGMYTVPILAGFDNDMGEGRIFKFDVIGSPTEERKYSSMGSGTVSTTGSLPMLYPDEPTEVGKEELVRRILKALKQVVATDMGSGIAPEKGIWPSLKVIDKNGVKDVSEEELKSVLDALTREGE
jgi:proteasome beta subunit